MGGFGWERLNIIIVCLSCLIIRLLYEIEGFTTRGIGGTEALFLFDQLEGK